MISLKNTLKAISSKFSALNTLLNDVPHYTLLWTNPNPTSAFAAQTISLDLSKYDAVEITFRSGGITTIRSDIDGIRREANYIESSGVGYIQAKRRGYTTSSTGIKFEEGYWNFGDHYPWNNAYDTCVPYKIYGIKFGGGIRLSVLSSLRRWLYVKFESYLKGDWGCLGWKGNEVYGVWNILVADDILDDSAERRIYQSRGKLLCKYLCLCFGAEQRKHRLGNGISACLGFQRLGREQQQHNPRVQRSAGENQQSERYITNFGEVLSFRLMPKGVFA